MAPVKEEYLERAKSISEREAELLLSRLRGRLGSKLNHKRLNVTEALALQLEYEDEQLNQWRSNIGKVRKKFGR